MAFALALVAPFVMWAEPAAAQSSPYTITVNSPAPGGVVTDSSSVTISGQVTFSGLGLVLQTVHVHVVRDSDGAVLADSDVCCATPQTNSTPFTLTTTALAFNGPYHLTVTASGYTDLSILGHPPTTPAQITEGFAMGVPAAAPTGLTFTLNSDRSVQLNWKAAPSYPDFIGYAIYRRVGAGDSVPIGAVGSPTTTYTDSTLGSTSGAVAYQVASVRQGANPGTDASKWLVTKSDSVVVNVPMAPTTVPGETTTTAPVGGGLVANGAAATAPDLGAFFSAHAPATLPPTTKAPTPTIPDTGFSETLPFGSTATTSGVSGRQAGRPSTASATGEAESSSDASSNRRALLVPVAGGAVLCVAALHLRWLNRRMAAAARGPRGLAGVTGLSTLGAASDSSSGVELEPELYDGDLFDEGEDAAKPGVVKPATPIAVRKPPRKPERETVGAGRR